MIRAVLVACAVLLMHGAAGADDSPSVARPAQASLCAGCHGAQGVPVSKAYPVIAGQNEGYLYLELRDYKLGHRTNAAMQAVAASLDKPTMLALAAYYAAQTWPALGQPAPAADVVRRAQVVEGSAACKGCHGAGYLGDSAIPRSAGQNVAYLRATMAAFRSGDRANNPWMTALLKTYSDADIDALAQYLAGL